MVRQAKNIEIIEWSDLKLSKFYGYGVLMSLSTRTLIYPTQLIKTRFQSQSLTGTPYKSFGDACGRIYKAEGFRGFYKGLHLNYAQIPVSYVYLGTFEYSKAKIADFLYKGTNDTNNSNTTKPKAQPNLILPYLLSGFFASALSQIVATPLDVVIQYKQVYHSTNMKKDANISGKTTFQICKQLYQNDGIIKGFYRGFTLSTLFFSAHSAMIWANYYTMLEYFGGLAKNSDRGYLHSWAGVIISAGISSSLATNMILLPLDTVRTRHQLQIKRSKKAIVESSITKTTKILIKSEGLKGLYRGWQPRVVQSFLSGVLFLAYESLKVVSSGQRLT